MVSQRGSVLIGVIGLSIVMSMAAGSLLIVASNSLNDEDMAFRRAGCYLDAESGLMMGVSWLRNSANSQNSIKEYQTWTDDTKTLLVSQLFDNGSLVTVTLVDNTATKTVISKAVHGNQEIQFSWDVGVDLANGTTWPPRLTLTGWRSP